MRFETLSAPYTADAAGVEMAFNGDDLEVRYVDIVDKPMRARFFDAVAFRWDPLALEGAPRDDVAYEVLDSPWLKALADSNQCPSTHRHFKLCFNAASVLDVVARDVVVDPVDA